MQLSQDQLNLLEEKIRSSLQKLDSRRVADKRKSLIISVSLTVLAIVLALTMGRKGDIGGAIGGILLLGFLSYFMIYSVFKRSHNNTYKAEIMPELVDAVIPGARYSKKGLITKDDIKEARIYNLKKDNKKVKSEDSVTGRIDKTDFCFSEVNIYHLESDGDNGTKRVNDLVGFAFVADFNKHFDGHTFLSSAKSHLDRARFSSYERCVLEDPDFERLYTTYTTNDQQARYILSPGLQHRIMQLHSFFGQREMAISFLGEKMMILFNSGTNHFEVKYDMSSVKNDLRALSLLCDIVEQMNLNLRIWSKE